MRPQRADDAAVRDDEDALTRVRRRDPEGRRDDALRQILPRLPVVPDLALPPARVAGGESLLDLGAS